MDLTVSPAGRRYGFKTSTFDHRDFGISHPAAPAAISASEPSPHSDLEEFCGPVADQGSEGSCTAHAGKGSNEFLYRKYAVFALVKPAAPPVFSAAFLYYMERQIDGTLADGDCGSTGRSSVSVLNRNGVCLEADMPYTAGSFSTAPNAEQLAGAEKFLAGAYHALSFPDFRSCLSSGYVFLIGFAVYESFENDVNGSGLMPMPDVSKEKMLGYHEVLVIGHDDSAQRLKVRNSWGPGWGASGDFFMPYAFAAAPGMILEARMQHLNRAWK